MTEIWNYLDGNGDKSLTKLLLDTVNFNMFFVPSVPFVFRFHSFFSLLVSNRETIFFWMRVHACFADANPWIDCLCVFKFQGKRNGFHVKKTSFQPVDCISKNIMNLFESFSLHRMVCKTKTIGKSCFHSIILPSTDLTNELHPRITAGVHFRGGKHGFCRWHLATLGELLASSSWKCFGVVWICGLRFLDFSRIFGCRVGNDASPEITEQKVLIANTNIFQLNSPSLRSTKKNVMWIKHSYTCQFRFFLDLQTIQIKQKQHAFPLWCLTLGDGYMS